MIIGRDAAHGESTDIDGSLTTWDGARRGQLRRRAALPLERVISALEAMELEARQLATADGGGT